MRKLILTTALLAAFTLGRAQDNPASRLSRDTILIGDQIEWIIPLEMAPGEKYFLEDISDPPAPGVEIIKPLELDTVAVNRKQVTLGSIHLVAHIVPAAKRYATFRHIDIQFAINLLALRNAVHLHRKLFKNGADITTIAMHVKGNAIHINTYVEL